MTKQELESLAGAGLPVGAETGLEQAELGRIEPVPPPQAGQEELTDMAELAEALAERILSEPDDRTFIRTVTASAEGVQSLAGSEFVLLRNSLGQVMDRMSRDEDRGIPADLKALREIMNRINPYPVLERIKKARNSGWLSRALKGLPTVGRLLADIAQRYESVQTQIDAIIDSLHAGSDRLMENALELEERYKNLKVLQHEVQLQAYRLEIIWSRLDRAFGEAEDQEERQRLHRAVVRIARRAQNLRVTEQAFAQMFVTMNTTIDNHENLRDAIQAMVGLTRPVLENGLALRIAQQEEKEIALGPGSKSGLFGRADDLHRRGFHGQRGPGGGCGQQAPGEVQGSSGRLPGSGEPHGRGGPDRIADADPGQGEHGPAAGHVRQAGKSGPIPGKSQGIGPGRGRGVIRTIRARRQGKTQSFCRDDLSISTIVAPPA